MVMVALMEVQGNWSAVGGWWWRRSELTPSSAIAIGAVAIVADTASESKRRSSSCSVVSTFCVIS